MQFPAEDASDPKNQLCVAAITLSDPLLALLANNGGPAQTLALPANSPAIDAGSTTSCPATDQRGIARPVDGNGDGTAICDVGAYEYTLALASEYVYLPLVRR
ncbi:MAG: hypothetical protein HC837_16665 [Chloroflexaceae bacterium]|nr:hypothetical protein [Chloroflexaceae bacterium]